MRLKMDKSIHQIVEELKSLISDKYKMTQMKIFGSTARDRRRPDSDKVISEGVSV